jgi:hypothetical protein
MTAPRVYLQTQNAHGSWVTPRDASGKRLEFTLSRATLHQLSLSPANARLVCCATGKTLATKPTLRTDRLRLANPLPAEPAPQPRPVILKRSAGHHTPIVIAANKNHVRSWYAPVVMR